MTQLYKYITSVKIEFIWFRNGMEWISSSRPLWMSLFYKILHLWLFILLLLLLFLLFLILPLLSCLYSSKLFSVLISSWWFLVCRDGRGVVVLQTVRVHWLQLQLVHQRVSCLEHEMRKGLLKRSLLPMKPLLCSRALVWCDLSTSLEFCKTSGRLDIETWIARIISSESFAKQMVFT